MLLYSPQIEVGPAITTTDGSHFYVIGSSTLGMLKLLILELQTNDQSGFVKACP